jgi:fumarate reductase subunit C
MTEFRLYLIQRASAALLALLVLIHLGVIGFAMHQGLSAAFILGRTRSSLAWPALYALFTLVAASHATIGLRTIVRERLGWRNAKAEAGFAALWLALVALGLNAVTRIA